YFIRHCSTPSLEAGSSFLVSKRHHGTPKASLSNRPKFRHHVYEGLRFVSVLRGCLRRGHFRAGGGVAEVQEPRAGDVFAVHFRRGELPVARGVQGEIREIFAWPGSIEFGSGHVTRGIHIHLHVDSDGTADRVARLSRHVGQDLLKHLTSNQIARRRLRNRLGRKRGRWSARRTWRRRGSLLRNGFSY